MTVLSEIDSRAAICRFGNLFDPSKDPIPKPGENLPPFDTPTTADGRGVNPVCTRQPACALHDLTLTQALQTGKPVAYLIGTPAFMSDIELAQTLPIDVLPLLESTSDTTRIV